MLNSHENCFDYDRILNKTVRDDAGKRSLVKISDTEGNCISILALTSIKNLFRNYMAAITRISTR